ncbi:t-complex protein 1 subunit zeta 2 [Nicotiana attenuata]|uniref:T-complex protein 1 subunit zeta 2 n=1 Tax=Nicotiana attenuata TaxID=49451 RepID=A0A1J6IPU9_NICAT|nr:t-complex protein 1 subunit zeta 2 [Nicotiana attenuata]
MSVKVLNPNAEVLNKSATLHMNINAAKGLHDVLKTNLGLKGTIKMLVGGAGDIKLTKDGNTLLKEMQIQNPTAIMIGRTPVAQDDIVYRENVGEIKIGVASFLDRNKNGP